MKKFIRNICALTLGAVMLTSGCATQIKGNTADVEIESGDTYAVISVENYGDITVKLFPEAAPVGVQNFVDLAESGYYEGKLIHRVIGDFMFQGGSLNGDGTGGTAADGGDFECEINGGMRHFYGALCYANAAGSNSCQFYIVNNKTPQTVDADFYEEYVVNYNDAVAQCKEIAALYGEGTDGYNYYITMAESYENMADGAEKMKKTINDDIIAKYSEVGGVPFLDGGYTVFGQTVDGFDVIDAISSVETELGSDGAESKPLEDILIKSVEIKVAE